MRSDRVQSRRSEMFEGDWINNLTSVSWLINFKKHKLPHCHLYFIGPEGKPFTKVGISVNPYKRLAEIQTGSWEPVKIHGSFWLETVHQARKMEKELHTRMQNAGLHSAGEWFAIRPKDAIEEAYVASMDLGLKLNNHFPSEEIEDDVWNLARDFFYSTSAHKKSTFEERTAMAVHQSDKDKKKDLARVAEYGISKDTLSGLRIAQEYDWEKWRPLTQVDLKKDQR